MGTFSFDPSIFQNFDFSNFQQPSTSPSLDPSRLGIIDPFGSDFSALDVKALNRGLLPGATAFDPVTGGAGFVGLTGDKGDLQTTIAGDIGQFQPVVDAAAGMGAEFGSFLQGQDPFAAFRQFQQAGATGMDFGPSRAADLARFNVRDFRRAGGPGLGRMGAESLAAARRFGQAAGMSQDEFVSGELNRLRDLARPAEQRAANSLADRLFASGRLGTTGGATQFGELARAQELADLDRTGMAIGLGMQRQDQLARLAQQFGQQGMAARGLQDQLRGSAFGRVAQGDELARQRALSRFGVARDIFQGSQQPFETAFAGFNQALKSGLTGQELMLNPLRFSLAAAQMQAQQRLGREQMQAESSLLPDLIKGGSSIAGAAILA